MSFLVLSSCSLFFLNDNEWVVIRLGKFIEKFVVGLDIFLCDRKCIFYKVNFLVFSFSIGNEIRRKLQKCFMEKRSKDLNINELFIWAGF